MSCTIVFCPSQVFSILSVIFCFSMALRRHCYLLATAVPEALIDFIKLSGRPDAVASAIADFSADDVGPWVLDGTRWWRAACVTCKNALASPDSLEAVLVDPQVFDLGFESLAGNS